MTCAPRLTRVRPAPGPTRCRRRPTPDPMPLPPDPNPRPDLVGPRRTHADRAVGLRGALGHLRRAAGRHRGRARAGATPIPTAELPALAAASFALSKLVVHEKVESWMRRPFVDEDAAAAEGPPAPVRRRRAADCARAAPARGARSGSSRCALHSPAAGRTVVDGARRVGRQRHAAGRVSVAVRARHHRAEGRPPTRRSCAASAMPRDRCVHGVDMSCFGRQHSGPCHG